MMFADDSVCIKEFFSPFDYQLAQLDLDQLVHWCSVWGVSFNVNKCVHLHFGSSTSLRYTINQSHLPSLGLHKDLGVWIASDQSWSKHISQILAGAYRSLSLIRRVRWYPILVPFLSNEPCI